MSSTDASDKDASLVLPSPFHAVLAEGRTLTHNCTLCAFILCFHGSQSWLLYARCMCVCMGVCVCV